MACVSMHESMKRTVAAYWDEVRRRYYVTPSTYIDFIHTYATMLHETKEEFVNSRNRLVVGLSRLSESETIVADMKEELTALGPKIELQTKVYTDFLLVVFDDCLNGDWLTGAEQDFDWLLLGN
jgi:dynein heavy chain